MQETNNIKNRKKINHWMSKKKTEIISINAHFCSKLLVYL